MTDIPHKYYYLAEDFSPDELSPTELKDILERHNINVPRLCGKERLLEIWNDEMTDKRQSILQTLTTIQPEYYYLAEDFDPSTVDISQLKEILRDHGISYRGIMPRLESYVALFKKTIGKNRLSLLQQVNQEGYVPVRFRYLVEDFDPQTLALNELKDILKKHNIPFFNHGRTALIEQWQNEVGNRRLEIITQLMQQGEISPTLAQTLIITKFDSLANKNFFQRLLGSVPTLSVDDDESEAMTPQLGSASESHTGYESDTNEIIIDDSSNEDEAVNTTFYRGRDRLDMDSEEVEDKTYDLEEDLDADADDSLYEDEDDGIDKEELLALIKDLRLPASEVRASMMKNYQQRKYEDLKKNMKNIVMYLNMVAFFLVCACAMTTFYTRKQYGYCDWNPTTVTNETITLTSLLPSPCIPCPEHATCIDGEMYCDKFFNRKQSIYSLNHTLPIADHCIYDTTYAELVDKMERRIRNALATIQGKTNCRNYQVNDKYDLRKGYTVEIPLRNLRQSNIDRAMAEDPNPEIEFIADAAIGALSKDPKVRIRVGDEDSFISTEYVKIPYICLIMEAYRSIPDRVKLYMLGCVVCVYVVLNTINAYKRRLRQKDKLKQLLTQVTDILKEQRAIHNQHPKSSSPSVSAADIRARLFDMTDRDSIKEWQMLVGEMESNPHFRKFMFESRGEPVEFWELAA